MLLLVAYALIVWYGAMRFRRRVAGFVIALLGGLCAMLVGRAVPAISLTRGDAVGMQWLIYAEAVLVAGMGLFIACLPRAPAYPHCKYCRYDLRGLEGEASACPECGQPLEGCEGLTPTGTQARLNEIAEDERLEREAGEARAAREAPSASAPPQQPPRADQENQQRQHGDQTPLQG